MLCAKRWYRYADECRECPKGVPVGVILLAVLGGGFLLYVSSMLSKFTTPQAVALLRSLIQYLQYLSLSLSINVRWPAALLRFFAYLRALTNGIDLAAPECVSNNWSYALYVQLLCAGLAIIFALLALRHEWVRFRKRSIRLRPLGALHRRRDTWWEYVPFVAPLVPWTQEDNEALLQRVHELNVLTNSIKATGAFILSFR